MSEKTDTFIPTRRSLLTRLKDWDDQESWREFFDTYWRLIYATAIKAGLKETEAQEVVQETVISVAKKMSSFKYDPALGKFKGWLMQLTRWRITDQLRKRKPDDPGPGRRGDDTRDTATIDRIPDEGELDIDAVWNDEWERNLFDAALDKVKRQIPGKQYQIFDAYVLREMPPGKVAKSLGVSMAQVYVTKHRVGKLLKKEIKRLEEEML